MQRWLQSKLQTEAAHVLLVLYLCCAECSEHGLSRQYDARPDTPFTKNVLGCLASFASLCKRYSSQPGRSGDILASWSARCRPRQRIQARVARARRDLPKAERVARHLATTTTTLCIFIIRLTTSNYPTIRLLLQILSDYYFKYYTSNTIRLTTSNALCITLSEASGALLAARPRTRELP